MKLAKKFWLWMFEFRIRKLRDKEKIEFLTKELLKEIEAQGYSLKSTDAVYGIDVSIYTSNNRLDVVNQLSHWRINCGEYEPKIDKSEYLNVNEVAEV